MTATAIEKGTPEYRRWYRRGWRYSQVGAEGLDYADRKGYPEAWYDGYLDFGAGREKYHYESCDGTCGRH